MLADYTKKRTKLTLVMSIVLPYSVMSQKSIPEDYFWKQLFHNPASPAE